MDKDIRNFHEQTTLRAKAKHYDGEKERVDRLRRLGVSAEVKPFGVLSFDPGDFLDITKAPWLDE